MDQYYNDDVVGVIAPVVLQEQLSHIKFKAGRKRSRFNPAPTKKKGGY